MQPPIPASEVDAATGMIIAEMQRLRGDLEKIVGAPQTGGAAFFLSFRVRGSICLFTTRFSVALLACVRSRHSCE